MNLGLVLAEQDPPDLTARLDSELRAMADEYDRTLTGTLRRSRPG